MDDLERDKQTDKAIGKNVARFRGELSQAALAQKMKNLGHKKWSQATIWALEKGERALKLSEAQDLAALLHVDVKDFVTLQDEEISDIALAAQTARLMNSLNSSAIKLGETLTLYFSEKFKLKSLLDHFHDTDQISAKTYEELSKEVSFQEVLRDAARLFILQQEFPQELENYALEHIDLVLEGLLDIDLEPEESATLHISHDETGETIYSILIDLDERETANAGTNGND